MVDGIVKLLFSDEVLPLNIGNPDEITISEMGKIGIIKRNWIN